MTVSVKICGLSTPETVEATLIAGTDLIGFVFYPKSPRAVTVSRAAQLARLVPRPTRVCGLFVDSDDNTIFRTLDTVPLDVIQLHGTESPERCAYLRRATGRPIMKAIAVERSEDVDRAEGWYEAVDLLLFDAKPPRTEAALPGGNGTVFDWSLLADRRIPVPWILSGGLSPNNVVEAIRRTHPSGVDVSSGVESSPGIKDPALIKAFLEAARSVG